MHRMKAVREVDNGSTDEGMFLCNVTELGKKRYLILLESPVVSLSWASFAIQTKLNNYL